MALGLKGGFSLAESGFNPTILRDLMFAVGLALAIPTLSFVLLTRLLNHWMHLRFLPPMVRYPP